MTGLYLGAVVFEGFEVPDHIEFGGKQSLVIHKLIGGGRVIDALGRDDMALNWSGVLSGPEAASRARSLDAMRVEGAIQSLSWDAFCYSVVIAQLHLQFRNPWWIPYRISCAVQADLAQGVTVDLSSGDGVIASDIQFAGSFLGAAFSQVVGSASSLVASGKIGQGQAITVLTAAQDQVSTSLLGDQAAIQSDDLGTVVTAAGDMANLSCANGYLRRAVSGLGLLGA